MCGTYKIPNVNMIADKIFFRSDRFKRRIKGIGTSMIQMSMAIVTKAPAQKMSWVLIQEPPPRPSQAVQ